jgi:hypothetical protein
MRGGDFLLAISGDRNLAIDKRSPVHAVVAEFPLKKKANYQSTNVDHLFVCPVHPRPRIFLELKTDRPALPDEWALFQDIVLPVLTNES